MLSRNRPYALALMGALLALSSFYFLPYLCVQVSVRLFGLSADRARTYLATDLISTYEALWLCSLSVFVVLLLVLLQLCNSPAITRSRLGGYLLIIAGGAGMLVLLWVLTQIYQRPLDTLPDFSGVAGLSGSSSFSFTFGSGQATLNVGVGVWCYLLGMLIVMISGMLALTQQP